MNPAPPSSGPAAVPAAGPESVDRPTRALLADGSPALVHRLGPECAEELLDLHRRLS
jgi:hypothetical protein